MKASELRIGNLVTPCGNKPYRVESVDNDGCMIVPVDNSELVDFDYECDLEPIPLTEEWLVKFGFEYKDGYLTLELGYFSGSNFIYWIGDVLNLFCKSGMMLTNNIKYVHQLQNLYFALTGEELKIK